MLYELLLRPKLGSIMPYMCATDNILVGLIITITYSIMTKHYLPIHHFFYRNNGIKKENA